MSYKKKLMQISAYLLFSLSTLYIPFIHADNTLEKGRIVGSVTAPGSFKAAQVYLRNTDMRLQYMVYTQNGHFRAISLFPGSYEVSVKAKGYESDITALTINAGDNPDISLTMHELPPGDGTVIGSTSMAAQNTRLAVTLESYEDLYPEGEGRNILERTCMICHGENWIPAQPAPANVWEVRIDHMMGRDLFDRSPSSYAQGLLSYRAQWLRFSREDRETLVAYLDKNFGIDSKPRMVKTEQETPLDEAKLAKAMYIEYYVPKDGPGYGLNDPKYKDALGPFSKRRTLQDPRFDAEGNVWMTDRGFPVRLVKLNPITGEWDEWITPNPTSDLHELIVGRDGIVWVPEHAEGEGVRNYLLGFNPKTENWDYMIDMDPNDVVRGRYKWADSISIDSKNNIYVNWIMGGALTKIDGNTKKVVGVYPLATTNAIPYGNVIDSKDNVFLALWGRGGVAKFDTLTNAWTEFYPPTYPGEVRRLNVDQQDNIWFGIYSAGAHHDGKLAKLDQKTGRFTEYTIPEQYAQFYDVSSDPQGNIWFVDTPTVDRSAAIGVFNVEDEAFTFYPKPQFSVDSAKIQVSGQTSIWYTTRGSITDDMGIGVLYPDMDKIETLGAFYENGPPGYPFKH